MQTALNLDLDWGVIGETHLRGVSSQPRTPNGGEGTYAVPSLDGSTLIAYVAREPYGLEAVKIMQETLQVLQVLRQEDEDLRRKLDAIKGEDSVYSATISAASSHK